MGDPTIVTSSVDFSSEMYLPKNDFSSHILSTQKLNGKNYGQWMRSAEFSLNTLEFVRGTCARPKDDPAKEAQWDRCDSMVISWILHSLEPEIQ